MQVNLHGSPCIPGVFYYCFSHEEKQNLASKSPRKRAISTIEYKKNAKGAMPPSQAFPPVGSGCKSISIWVSMHSGCIFVTVLIIKKNKIQHRIVHENAPF